MKKLNRNSICILYFMILSFMLISTVRDAKCDDSDTIVGSAHDLSLLTGGGMFSSSNENQICIFCHTPHNALVKDSSSNMLPLWNRPILRNETGFTLYASNTLNATVGQPTGISLLCMSCHDGVTALNSLINYGQTSAAMDAGADQIGDIVHPGAPEFPGTNIGGATPAAYVFPPYGGTDSNTKRLDDDHPVSFLFDEALSLLDGGLVVPESSIYVDIEKKLPLYGGNLECATCHDPHKQGNPAIQGPNHTNPFLRKTNKDSALCLTCHLK